MNLDKYLEKLSKCQPLPQSEMKKVCLAVRETLVEEQNVVFIKSPVIVCGDIHGQFHDLLQLFKTSGGLPNKNYVFLGDYVDRGFNSLETLSYLLVLKLRFPTQITLLRGNHESRQITQIYGFHDECQRKYGNSKIWRMICEIFDCLNIAALIDNSIFCIHGGLSPDIRTINQIKLINRKREVPQHGPFCDLMWSDPEDIETYNISSRGAGWLFGSRVTKEFNHLNKLSLICRAHQIVQKGYKYHFKENSIVTIWSAPNYCYRCGNLAAVIEFNEKLEANPFTFKETPEVHKKTQEELNQKPMYFL